VSVTYTDALDDMFGTFSDVLSDVETILDYAPQVRWPGIPEPANTPMDQLWMRVSTQMVKEGQSSLSDKDGTKRYESHGLLYVQLFAPRTVSNTLNVARQAAEAIRNRFRKASLSGEVWFRNQVVRELPETTENYPLLVVVEFTYQEVQ
jgi:hypothetical protein